MTKTDIRDVLLIALAVIGGGTLLAFIVDVL